VWSLLIGRRNRVICAHVWPMDCRAAFEPIRRSARAVRQWHSWRGHSLLQDARVGGVLRGLARVSGIGGECFSWMGRGSSAATRLLLS
jgi:hypothetical protein